MTLVLAVAILFASAFLLRSDMVAKKAERLKPPHLAEGTMASYDWVLSDATGVARPFSEFQGMPVFLQFWSTGCTSCEAEVPAVNALYDAVKDQGVAFVAVETDLKPEELSEAAARFGIRYPIFARSGSVPDVFKFTAGPATFLIRPDGEIAFKHIGAARWDDPKVLAYLSLLSAPLAKGTTSPQSGPLGAR